MYPGTRLLAVPTSAIGTTGAVDVWRVPGLAEYSLIMFCLSLWCVRLLRHTAVLITYNKSSGRRGLCGRSFVEVSGRP